MAKEQIFNIDTKALWHYESGTIKCVYPNKKLPAMSFKNIVEIKRFGKIVLNYLKIKRIEKVNETTGH